MCGTDCRIDCGVYCVLDGHRCAFSGFFSGGIAILISPSYTYL